MEGMDIHSYQQNFESTLEKVRIDDGICKENKEAIVSFCKKQLAKGHSYGRVAKVAFCLRKWAMWLKKPFKDATKDDLISIVGDLEANPRYAHQTKYDFKVILKMIYKYVKGNDEVYPPEISWLRQNMKKQRHKLPEELLSEEEVLKMANAADTIRDKAFILVLYETGCRIGEILTTKIKNVMFDQYGAILRVTGKTGDRRVRIISSAPILANWIDIHPYKNDPESIVWYPNATNRRNHRKVMKHQSVYVLIRKLANDAGVSKRVYPHLFRHSRATAMAGKFTEAQMKEYFGWVQGSDMAATYVHLSGRDVDNTLLKLHGLAKPEEEQEDKMKVRSCARCKEHNSPIAQFCIKCGLPLDQELLLRVEKERESSDDLMNKLMEDKEFRELMMKKILEKGLQKNIVH
ncbi:MAG: tyrosine-type recombinase/integrase [Candidatus Micrarchaeota archaeon]|nr:site-specific integrase [Candidatus Micrarchaeota archaeon]MBU1886334.1 site-specific integrase [Candidatus Micrarchaeota archaeon]